MRTRLIALFFGLLFAAGSAQAADTRWIHIFVQDGPDEEIRLNVPINLVRAVLPLIDEDEISNGRIVIDDHDIPVEVLRQVWEEVRDIEEGEFVKVDTPDEDVRISKKGSELLITVLDSKEESEVTVRLHESIIAALLSSDRENELDLLAALDALDAEMRGDLVNVQEEGTVVRIWVDDTNEGN
ncbi:MAG: hypothetical protein HKN20_17185 [Gemmatimonadetes bacterium]|nr:hypothetical protein [Gemmatimonadota bacterium]